jgi:hypothetical protein
MHQGNSDGHSLFLPMAMGMLPEVVTDLVIPVMHGLLYSILVKSNTKKIDF